MQNSLVKKLRTNRQTLQKMSAFKKIITLILPVMLLILLADTGCMPARRAPAHSKKMTTQEASTTPMGRNRYYYSPSYQKKLNKNFRRK
mgnify:FL=1